RVIKRIFGDRDRWFVVGRSSGDQAGNRSIIVAQFRLAIDVRELSKVGRFPGAICVLDTRNVGSETLRLPQGLDDEVADVDILECDVAGVESWRVIETVRL